MSPAGEGRGRVALYDAGGVLFEDGVLAPIVRAAGRDPADPAQAALWDREVRAPFWRGRMSIPEMFRAVGAPAGAACPEVTLRPLPWAERALRLPCRKAVLSNHRHEWLLPAIDRLPGRECLERVYVSSLLGHCKPDRDAFLAALLDWAPDLDDEVVFVDDKEANLAAARALGLLAVWADPAGRWVGEVERLVAGGPQHTREEAA